MSAPESSKSPVPQAGPAGPGNKLDNLSKEDLVKFAKKQVAHLAEMKKNQTALMEKLKIKIGELEQLKTETENLKLVNNKLTLETAQKVENNPTECTECLSKSGALVELEKEIVEWKEKATRADMFSLELRDLESKVDQLNRALREKTEALIKAQEVITENDLAVNNMKKETTTSKSSIEKLTEENNRLTKAFQDEKAKSTDLEVRLRSAESKIVELSDQQGNEKLGLARKMAESENRGRILEEAVDVLKSEKELLISKNEEYASKLDTVEKEFSEFKKKSHFVLEKKGKQEDETRKLTEELEKAKTTIVELEQQADLTRQEHFKTIEDLASSRDKTEKLERSFKALKVEMADTEKSHSIAIDDLRSSSSKLIQRLDEELRLMRSSRDTAEEKLRDIEMAKEKVDHLLHNERQRSENENGSLKSKLASATKQIQNLEKEIQDLKSDSETRRIQSLQNQQQKAVAAVVPQQILIPDTQMPPHHYQRPVVAPSDSVSCYDEPTQPDRSLEDVLYGDLGDEYRVESDEFSEEKFKSLIEQLENFKKTNHHVAELLSEAETANGRLTTQNSLLKDEIRRLEREEKREAELSNEKNMEYLKNVFVQFLKPESVPAERDQLVVVLERVLHLSSKEVDILKAASAHMATAQSGSWSSYFSGWTATN
uniref:GRIP domain-containing protein n=1 Tax=Caenorhabditis tropicalis TaxID=1561998 RepID=A0A1I7UHQ0_9PELO